MGIVIPKGEALWLTVRAIDEDTPLSSLGLFFSMWSCVDDLSADFMLGAELVLL